MIIIKITGYNSILIRMTQILLDFLAFSSILSSILVITSRNPVVAVIYLISVFINAAGYLLILGVGFIGISYILLYVGAITILFLFVIMSINIKLTDIMEAGSQYTKNIPLALSIGILFIYELISILPNTVLNIQGGDSSFLAYPVELIKTLNSSILNSGVTHTNSSEGLMSNASHSTISETSNFVFSSINPTSVDTKISPLLQVESLGQELYTHGASWLILCSMILLLALVCPTFITRSSHS
jgi:NADH-ubiquinone oxidoreductase chain 6